MSRNRSIEGLLKTNKSKPKSYKPSTPKQM